MQILSSHGARKSRVHALRQVLLLHVTTVVSINPTAEDVEIGEDIKRDSLLVCPDWPMPIHLEKDGYLKQKASEDRHAAATRAEPKVASADSSGFDDELLTQN